MPFFYRVPKLAAVGSLPVRPDVAAGTSWVGRPGPSTTYLIRTELPVSLLVAIPEVDLPGVCTEHGVSHANATDRWLGG